MSIQNSYANDTMAEAYARLEFPGTYYLAFRDLPDIFKRHTKGRQAIDFGCGTGRSTRFLHNQGFEVVGVDIAYDMVRRAREIDPAGDYRVIDDGDFSQFQDGICDLVLAAFTFDNIPTLDKKLHILKGITRLLSPGGVMVNLVSAPEIYTNEWASFSTKDFPENNQAKSGDKVKIIITDIDDKRPVEDVIWSDEDYRQIFSQAGLSVIETYKPLGKEDEPFKWVNETRISPWSIYVLGKD
ncbi:MAG: class I SAM-dependent methyltransferase [Chitinophagales bacterium]